MPELKLERAPELNGSRASMEALRRYLNRMTEALNYTLGHLDDGNIAAASLTSRVFRTLEADVVRAYEAVLGKATIGSAEIQNLRAQVAKIVTADIGTMNVDWASIDRLEAAVADVAVAKIGTADIDFAQIKDLVAGKAIITQGVGNRLYIADLAVTEANVVSLSVGELLVKGQDGAFYSLTVDENGGIVTEKKLVIGADVMDHTLHGGEKIIEGSITAGVLNVRDIFADSAIVRELMAANIDVDTLFSREATISMLNGVDISGNGSLKLFVQDATGDLEGRITLAENQLRQSVTRAYVEDELSAMSSDMQSMRASILEQAEDRLSLRFDRVDTRVEELGGVLTPLSEKISAYFLFGADGTLTLGKSDSSFKAALSPEKLAFLQGMNEVAYISNQALTITMAKILQSIQLGKIKASVGTKSNGRQRIVWGLAE